MKKTYNNVKELINKMYDIYKKRELTIDEQLTVYQCKTCGLGYEDDPKVLEMMSNTNIKEELAKIFKCRPEEISSDENDLTNGKNIKYYFGDITSYYKEESQVFIKNGLPETVYGNVTLNLEGSDNVTLPDNIYGNLHISTDDVNKLKVPKMIENELSIIANGINGYVLPEKIDYALLFNVRDDCAIGNLDLTKATEKNIQLGGLGTIEYICNIKFAEKTKGRIIVCGKNLKDIYLPEYMEDGLALDYETAENIYLPKECKYICLEHFDNLDGLVFPDKFSYKMSILSNSKYITGQVNSFEDIEKLLEERRKDCEKHPRQLSF